MTSEIINQILDDSEYDAERAESLREMVLEAFAKRMRSVTIIVGGLLALFIALSIWVTILFFQAEDTWHIVLYATIFNTLMLAIAGIRIFLWQTLHRGRLQRDIKRLELRVMGLTMPVAPKPEQP
jgi:hypothetical protein